MEKELRIGNLLRCPAIGDTYTDRTPNYGFCVFQVYQINANGTIKLDIGFGATQEVDLITKDAEPIPLTEEWLLKFGLKTDGEYYVLPNFEPGIYLSNTCVFGDFKEGSVVGDYDACVTFKIPEYVHQLQNLYFCLTGKELTLKETE